MCGIFCARTVDEYYKLLTLNLERGSSSFGALAISHNGIAVYKTNDLENLPTFKGVNLLLGHLRAPTGDSREFSLTNSHPFEYGEWLVAHNGIITNFKELNTMGFKVDSNIIPYLLHTEGFKAFEKLQGTWACWMYNTREKQLYVTRSNATLFVNLTTGDFSSKKPDNSAFYQIQQEKIFKIHMDSKYVEPILDYQAKPLYFKV